MPRTNGNSTCSTTSQALSRTYCSQLLNGWWTGNILTVESGFAFSPTLSFFQSNALNNQHDRPDSLLPRTWRPCGTGLTCGTASLQVKIPMRCPSTRTPRQRRYYADFDPNTNTFTGYGWFNPNMFIVGHQVSWGMRVGACCVVRA